MKKEKKVRYRYNKGTSKGGTYTVKPVWGVHPIPSRTTTRKAIGVGIAGSLPKCPDSTFSVNLRFEVGASGFISIGYENFSRGVTFDAPMGNCTIPGTCRFINPIKSSSANAVSGLGSGARIQVYGRGFVDLKILIK